MTSSPKHAPDPSSPATNLQKAAKRSPKADIDTINSRGSHKHRADAAIKASRVAIDESKEAMAAARERVKNDAALYEALR